VFPACRAPASIPRRKGGAVPFRGHDDHQRRTRPAHRSRQQRRDRGRHTYRAHGRVVNGSTVSALFYDPANTTNPFIIANLGTVQGHTTYNVDVRVDGSGARSTSMKPARAGRAASATRRPTPLGGDARTTIWTNGSDGRTPTSPTSTTSARRPRRPSSRRCWCGSAGDRVISTAYDVLNRATQVTQPAVFTYDSSAPAGSPLYSHRGRDHSQYVQRLRTGDQAVHAQERRGGLRRRRQQDDTGSTPTSTTTAAAARSDRSTRWAT